MKDHFIKKFKNKKGHEIVIKNIDYVLLFEFNEFLKNFVSKSEDFYQIKNIILGKEENTNMINIMKLIEDNKCLLICSMHGEKIIGFSGILIDKYPDVGVFEIFIHKNYRNSGIGKELILAIIKYSYQIGLKKLTLSVRSNNIGAIHLYKKMGFEKKGKTKNSIIYNKSIVREILMVKNI